MTASFQ